IVNGRASARRSSMTSCVTRVLLIPGSYCKLLATSGSRRRCLAAMALILGGAALCATLLGGGFALRYQDKLHLILGFSAGAVLGVAVLAHDFSDGINTVTIVLRNRGKGVWALRWLLVDAAAPLLGVASTSLYGFSDVHLGIVLAIFCGFFLYIGASDLLPESHHRH